MADTIRGAVIGYGAAFNMGKAHANMMQRTDGIECVAVCDIDPERTAAAAADFPGIRTYNTRRSTQRRRGCRPHRKMSFRIVYTVVQPSRVSKQENTLSLKNRCVSRLQKRQR